MDVCRWSPRSLAAVVSVPGSDAGRLPGALTRYVGHEADRADLRPLVVRGPIVTLVGAPGCGKTRLGVELAADLAEQFDDGVRFIDLATISDPAQVASAVAAALDVREETGRPTEDTVARAMQDAEVLVLLDTCEHVVEAAARLTLRLVTNAPAVRVIATSRVPLGLSGEQVWAVPPLDTEGAVELFVDRAGLVSREFGDDPGGRAHVEEICRRLDGLPLAIELVAAFTRVLSVEQIADRLDGALPLLSTGGRDATARQHTMEATVQWSYRLLEPDEQQLFDRLSVFASGFDLAAVEAVADGPALAGLTTLVDHSLVLAESVGGGPMRYRVLEPIRQCGEAGLIGRGEYDEVRDRHAEHYLAVARGGDGEVRAGDVADGLQRLDLAQPNFRVALEWTRRRRADLGLRLCAALARCWELRGRVNEGRDRFEQMLGAHDYAPVDVDDDTADACAAGRATALARAARLAWRQRDYQRAEGWLRESVAIGRRFGDELAVARRLRSLALVTMSKGDPEAAIELCQQSIETFQAHDDDRGRMWSLIFLGWARYVAGERELGDEHMKAALGLSGRIGDGRASADAHFGMSYSAYVAHDTSRERSHLVDALADLRESGGIVEEPDWVWAGAALAANEHRARALLRLAGAAESLSRQGGTHLNERFLRPFLPLLEQARNELGPTVAARLASEGERMTLDELVVEATGEPDEQAGDSLSPREREVLELVAQGMTNVEIGERLYISKRTVESHVEHIKQKLGLGSRARLMAWGLDPSVRAPNP
jgi:predicted ATPase/DNA-binding CsgD family transcriptional regulator